MSFWGMLGDAFSGKGATKKLEQGVAAVNQGKDQQVDAFKTYGDQAKGELAPYREQGSKAFGLYNDTLGVNGAGARGAAQDIYNTDNELANQRALDLKRSGQVQNASGSFNSGTAALADSRVRLQNYGNWQNQLAGVGQQGQQAATTTAGIDQGTGAGIASSYGNASNALAGLYGQEAQAANAPLQNLIGLGSVAASAFAPRMPTYGVNNLAGYSPGTQANGGWSTSTAKASSWNPMNWWS